MKKTIEASLSSKEIEKLINGIKEFKQQITDKNAEFARRLAEVGIPVIDTNIAQAGFTYDAKGIESGADTEHNTYIKLHTFDDYAEAILITSGRELLFIEFGSGIYYNGAAGTSPHPKGQEFGFVIGSYGKGNGVKQVWGYYDEGGNLVLTHGVKATMPMYKAQLKIADDVYRIAREVFS